MRPTQRLQQWCCGWAWQLADFSLPPPPSLQQWIISPAEWGGELQVVHSGFKASSHCSLSDSSPRADDPFQPDNLQPFYAVLMLHMSLSGTLAKVNSFFWLSGPAASLMSRCCVYRHVTLKSWSLETWLHVFSLPFFRNPVICAQFFHT